MKNQLKIVVGAHGTHCHFELDGKPLRYVTGANINFVISATALTKADVTLRLIMPDIACENLPATLTIEREGSPTDQSQGKEGGHEE